MDAIQVQNVTKMYKLYDKTSDRLLEAISIKHKQYYKPFYALNNVSFSIAKGETVGIIGTNGSGKSTILKIITGVTQATKGDVKVNGKVSALLELGSGFDPEYTGVENIYMNGLILGYTREEMDVKKEEILTFADIGDFVYQPVKTYSSGMLVRLAFALAINVEPEILIIDEALAVGDAFFQAKCFQKLEEIKQSGTTILFVSHDILSVKKLCSRAIWIEKGNLLEDGDAGIVCEKYMGAQIDRNNEENEKLLQSKKQLKKDSVKELNNEVIEKQYILPKLHATGMSAVSGTGVAEICSFYIKDEEGKETKLLKPMHTYCIGIVAEFKQDVEDVLFGFELDTVKGVRVLGMNTYVKDCVLDFAKKGKIYEVVFEICLPKIAKGEYLITPAVAKGTQDNHVVIHRLHDYESILIDNDGFNLSLLDIDANVKTHQYDNSQVMFV